MTRRRACRREAATTVELACVVSVLFLLILGLIAGGLGILRYELVAHLAREGARYASTHGGAYSREGAATRSGVPAVNTSDDLLAVLLPKASVLDPTKLTITASWSGAGKVTPANMPAYVDTTPTNGAPGQIVHRNYVTVTVSYRWMPEVFLVGPITLTSTSCMPMSY